MLCPNRYAATECSSGMNTAPDSAVMTTGFASTASTTAGRATLRRKSSTTIDW